MTAGQEKPVVETRPALRKPIGITGKERMTQRGVGDVGRNVTAERIARNTLQFLRNLPDRIGCTIAPYRTHCTHRTRPPIDRFAHATAASGAPRPSIRILARRG